MVNAMLHSSLLRTLNLAAQVERAYRAEAHARGVYLETLVRDVLLERRLVPANAELAPEQWVAEFKACIHSRAAEDFPLLSDDALSRDFIYRERGL